MIFPGLYRGIVKVNDDSAEDHPYLCRVKVYVPQVYGKDIVDDDLPWAYPCMPIGGGQPTVEGEKVGFGFVSLPPVGTSVWIAFEHGDPSSPIWLGTWYGEKDETPELPTEAIRDVGRSSGETYPRIFLLKAPFANDGLWIRILGDKRLEIVFEDQKTYLEFDADGEQVHLRTETWDAIVESISGKVALRAGIITGTAPSADAGQAIEIDPVADTMTIRAKTLNISADDINIISQSGFKVNAESSHNASEKASGWENHQ